MTTLVVGASGATGRLLVAQLRDRYEKVKAIVRSPDKLPDFFHNNDDLSLIKASILDISDTDMWRHVSECDAVAFCLGHNMSLKGIYGHPRRLVADAVRRLCEAVKADKPVTPVKFVLMNTAGNSNRDLTEWISIGQKLVIYNKAKSS